MDAKEAIFTRRSIKKFQPRIVERERLGLILEAARLSPSAGNLQNWSFIVVANPAKKQAVATSCQEQHWMELAPLLIVICADMDKARRMFGDIGESLYSIQNCACAAENMMLMCTALDLGSCFVSAFEHGELANLLNVPDSVRIQGVLAVGYPAEKPDMPVRYQLDNLVFFEKYGSRIENMDETMFEFGGMMRETIEKATSGFEKVDTTVHKESKGIFASIKNLFR